MKKTVIRQYAKLIAVKGVNIQKGQEVIINASVEIVQESFPGSAAVHTPAILLLASIVSEFKFKEQVVEYANGCQSSVSPVDTLI